MSTSLLHAGDLMQAVLRPDSGSCARPGSCGPRQLRKLAELRKRRYVSLGRLFFVS